jgi:hypothetical protein
MVGAVLAMVQDTVDDDDTGTDGDSCMHEENAALKRGLRHQETVAKH